MKPKISNLTWSNAIAKLLYQRGVKNACISPGSRNTPLTIAFTNHSKLKCFSHIDERSNSFFALGLSKTSDAPVVIITTSGTATANLFSAIIDAKLSMTPLIILTADRPWNLVDSGATQTINQKDLYGKHVIDMVDIDHKKQSPNILLDKIDKALNNALGLNNGIKGPVHLNIRFELPLYESCNNKIQVPKINKNYLFNSKTVRLPKFNRPLIICGPKKNNRSNQCIIEFAKKIKAPIFADSLSQMRHHLPENYVFSFYEHYLDSVKEQPDIIFRFNEKPTSKKLNTFLDNHKNKTYLINNHEKHNDDCQKIIQMKVEDIGSKIVFHNNIDNKWFQSILSYENKAFQIIDKEINKFNFQGKLFNKSINNFEKGSHLFIGSSTPIRSLDEFSGYFKKQLKVLSNHATRGIDGIISTALGMAYINKKNNYLFLGDISFFHDINAFHILKNESINLSIIIINNNGGQIFSRLPYSNKNIKKFDDFWITPLNIKIKNVAKLFNLKYFRKNIEDYCNNILKISSLKGVKIIEIKIDNKKDISSIEKINQKLLF